MSLIGDGGAQGFQKELRQGRRLLSTRGAFFFKDFCRKAPPPWPRGIAANQRGTLTKLDKLALELKRKNRNDLCFAYVRAQPWITSLLIDGESTDHLHGNLALFRESALTLEECYQVEKELGTLPEEHFFPDRWLHLAGA